MMIDSMEEIVRLSETTNTPFWRIVMDSDTDERQVEEEDSLRQMEHIWDEMVSSVHQYSGERRSLSGLAGGDGQKMKEYAATGRSLCGGYMQDVIATALCVGESNACMCRIVAAPTAGSCGVLPAVLVPLHQRGMAEKDDIIKALYTSSGIGAIIASRASISGAAGGCQAEIGAASAMAAGALVSVQGGSAAQISSAAAIALKDLMGLICDPVGGLVEVPCIKRNVIGAVNAISSADMAMAGIESRIPADEVIDCMGDVGSRLPVEFRETALGGLAATPFAKTVSEMLRKRD